MANRPPDTQGVLSLSEIDADALKVVRRLLSAGHEAYLVGGCVRDLYLGLRPKDFDIATSATPEAIRRSFRNSRIIGRRFKLAHVFFGPKIIETSTFRTAPPADAGDDPLITHDNEWGSVEDDARRRDFTINGLFFDVETQRIVDFVDGMDDLDARLIRTIGEPELRFREDPVRMIRAIKFAARLDFDFDPATWRALLDVAPDIVRCSQARVLEEIYKLLRGGAARRSFELLLESNLLQHMMPSYTRLYGSGDEEAGALALRNAIDTAFEPRPEPEPEPEPEPDADPDAQDEADAPSDDKPPRPPRAPAELFWRVLKALDEYISVTRHVVSNGVMQAALFAPLVMRDTNTTRQSLDRRIERLMTPVGSALGVARRDRELARQILMAHRRMIDVGSRRRRRASLLNRQYFHDALIFLGMAVEATGDGGSELARWTRMAAESAAAQQKSSTPRSRGGRRRRRGGRKRRKQGEPAAAANE